MNLQLLRNKYKCIVLLCFVMALACGVPGIAVADSPQVASTSRSSREEVLRVIPFKQINQATQKKLLPILKKPSVYRRMPIQTYRCDKDVHTFLVRYPEVIVNIWQLMDITTLTAKRTAPFEIESSDGVGTDSNIELVYGTPNLHVYYGSGLYKGSLWSKPIKGDCVIVLQTEFGSDAGGGPIVRDRLDMFLKMENAGINFLAKTLHPLIGKSADHNFVETTKFLSKISEASETNSAGVGRMAQRLTDCDPSVRQKFQDVAKSAAYRYSVRRQAAAKRQPASSNNPAVNASYQQMNRNR